MNKKLEIIINLNKKQLKKAPLLLPTSALCDFSNFSKNNYRQSIRLLY